MTQSVTLETTKKNDTIPVELGKGEASIINGKSGGSDIIAFAFAEGTDNGTFTYSQGMDGETATKDLVIKYVSGSGENFVTDTITITDYFTSTAGTATKSSVKTIQIGDEKYALTDLYTYEGDFTPSKKGVITGTAFSDIINGTDYEISTNVGENQFAYEGYVYTKNETAENKVDEGSLVDDNHIKTDDNKVYDVTDLEGVEAIPEGSSESDYIKLGDKYYKASDITEDKITDYTAPVQPGEGEFEYEGYIYKVDTSTEYQETVAKTGIDKIYGGAGNDVIDAGTGDDFITGGVGNNTIIYNAGDGQDKVYLTKGENLTIKYYDENKTSVYTDGEFNIDEQNGNVVITRASSGEKAETITLVGLSKKDLGANVTFEAYYKDGEEYKLSGEKIDINNYLYSLDMSYANKKNVINGTYLNENIDVSKAESGVTINAGAGNDVITGSAFNDTIKAVSGDNVIDGGAGNDKLYAGKGADTFNFTGEFGEDIIYSSNSADSIVFGSETDLSKREFIKEGNNLVIKNTDDNVADKVTLSNYFKQKEGTALDSVNGKLISQDAVINISGKGKITGTYLDDVITGSDKADTINGGKGDDVITAGKGNDKITGGAGDNTVIYNAGDGNDTIYLTKGEKLTIKYYDTASTADFADDNFTVTEKGKDVVISIKNNDGTYGSITIKNMTKNDLASSVKFEAYYGENKTKSDYTYDFVNDVYEVTGVAKGKKGVTINGTALNEKITGTDNNDVLKAGAGEDTLIGGKGNDKLYGGAGSNTYVFEPGDGNDIVYASKNGENILSFDDSVEKTYEIKGNDVIITSKSSVDGTPIEETVTVKDYLKGGMNVTVKDEGDLTYILNNKGITLGHEDAVKTQTVKGTFLNETINGGAKADKLYAGAGDDVVNGGAGNDTIYAQSGNNTITGGEGNDTLYSGVGNDTFIFDVGDGNDKLNTGKKAESTYDVLQFTAKPADAASETYTYTENGNNLVITRTTHYDEVEANHAGEGQIEINGYIYNNSTKAVVEGSEQQPDETHFTNEDGTKIYDVSSIDSGNIKESVEDAESSNYTKLSDGKYYLTSALGNGEDYTAPVQPGEGEFEYEGYIYTKNETEENKVVEASDAHDVTDSVTIVNYLKGDGSTTYVQFGDGSKQLLSEYLTNQNITIGNDESKKALTVKGTFLDETIKGGLKADKLYSGSGDDIINAGKGNDTIYLNGEGSKTLNFAKGDGNDVVYMNYDNVKANLVFDEGAELSYVKSGNDLVVNRHYNGETESAAGTDEKVTLKNYFINAAEGTELSINGKVFGSSDEVISIVGSATKANKIDVSDFEGYNFSITGGTKNDTYTVSDLTSNTVINDLGGANDTLNITLDDDDALTYLFNVDKSGDIIATGESEDTATKMLMILNKADTEALAEGKEFNGGIDILNFFDDGKIEDIKVNGKTVTFGESSSSSNFDAWVNEVKSSVAGWLTDNNYDNAAAVLDSGKSEDISSLLNVYQTGTYTAPPVDTPATTGV